MTEEHWWGKPLSKGYQVAVMTWFRDNPTASYTVQDVSDKLEIPKNSTSACLSVLHAEGWLIRGDGRYQLNQTEPIEDRNRVTYQARRPTTRHQPPKGSPFRAGEVYLFTCVTFDKNGNPLLQAEDLTIYRLSEV